MKPKVIVIGAGANGLGTALSFLQMYPNASVAIISDKYSPFTTSDVAAGMWGPDLAAGTPESKVNEWSSKTWDLYLSWLKEKTNHGISIVSGITICDKVLPPDSWRDITFGYKYLSQDQYKAYGSKYVYGVEFTTLFAEPSKFLPILEQKFVNLGGRCYIDKITSLADAAEKYKPDLIFNCSGIASYDLVPDHSVYPIRGQVFRVSAPWQKTYMIDVSDETFAYILPNQDNVVVGGTYYENDWNLKVDPVDSHKIWKNATNLIPSLKSADIIKECVGLRPSRQDGVRVDADDVLTTTKSIPIVHNYGHSGAGISMFWGTSQEAATIAVKIITKSYPPTCKL